MTLSILVFVNDPVTKEETTIELEGHRTLAGFESSRQDFWGAPIMRALGLTLLPSLAETNVYANDEEALKQLEQEAQLILANRKLILQNVRYDDYFIDLHVNNILYAIKRAREVNGGVVIW